MSRYCKPEFCLYAGSAFQCCSPVQMGGPLCWCPSSRSVRVLSSASDAALVQQHSSPDVQKSLIQHPCVGCAGCALPLSALHRLHSDAEATDDAADRSCTRAWLQRVQADCHFAPLQRNTTCDMLHRPPLADAQGNEPVARWDTSHAEAQASGTLLLCCQAFPVSPDRGGSGAVDSVACRPSALDEHAPALQVRCGRIR